MGAPVHMDLNWEVGRIALASAATLNVHQALSKSVCFESRRGHHYERLDQGHLYPLGRRRDKHVTGGARTSALLHRRRPLYLKSYPDSLYAGYSEPLLGLTPHPLQP